MKNTFYAVIITLYLFSFKSVFGQDPYVYIQIKILLTDTNITKTLVQDQYNLFIRKENSYKRNTWDRRTGTKMKFYSERQLFEDGESGEYCKEVIEITITHIKDTMIVRFKQDSLNNPHNPDCTIIGHFYLEIPFQKGYYEITNFADTDKGFIIHYNYKWTALPKPQKKLLIKR